MDKHSIKALINKTHPIIFEIGAFDGSDTKGFLEVFGDNMTIYCFEPDEKTANFFRYGGAPRITRPDFTGPLDNKNVILEQKAISNVNEFVEFNISIVAPQCNSLKVPNYKHPKDSFIKKNVECITLDKYTSDNNIELIDFIWADVQGAEDLMILGGENTFKNKVRYLFTEYAKNEDYVYYDNSPNAELILKLLGDNWTILHSFDTDLLLKNKNFE